MPDAPAKVELRQVEPCEFGDPGDLPQIPPAEYERRLRATYDACAGDAGGWVLVYADREHYANLTWLINFDPRFEEALLVLGAGGRRVLVLGNEGFGYTSVLPVKVETVLCQSFSLPGQKRETAPRLDAVLRDVGLRTGDRVAVVGWKYLEPEEADDVRCPAFVPVHLLDAVRRVVGDGAPVEDRTHRLMNPADGLRTTNSADQIAAFEWAARHASRSVFDVVRGARPGMREDEAARLLGYAGQPMSMHPIVASGARGEAINGLRSPTGRRLRYGDGISTAVGYWGSLFCRAGVLAGEPDRDYMGKFVAPYFGAIAAWYGAARVGATGGQLFDAVERAFGDSGLSSTLNPGHLTSYDEWSHSPVRRGGADAIRSGMVFQVDIIPTPIPAGLTLNCEDTVAFADASLRDEIRTKHPDLWRRTQARRDHMREELGLDMSEDVLPLSDCPAYLPPFWLADRLVCAVGG